ncbi:MAG: hypothetical protein AAB393_07385, partial [Bacteroidota bacterium]
DITGFIVLKDRIHLVFAEVKIAEIGLADVGQILGYSRVARPYLSMLVSLNGCSAPLESILVTYGRYDILEYQKGRMIKIAKWLPNRNDIDPKSILPRGESIL